MLPTLKQIHHNAAQDRTGTLLPLRSAVHCASAMAGILASIIIATGCQNFSGPAKGEKRITVDPCDTVNVSYTKTIQPILKENCYSCHSNAIQTVGVNLEGYANVKIYADATLLVGVSSRLPGYAQMPPPGPLSDCNMRLIRVWVNQGTKNN